MLANKKWRIFHAAAVCLLLNVEQNTAFGADKVVIGTLYPQVREPYREVFRNIIVGIKRQAKGSVKVLELKQADHSAQLQAWQQKHQIQTVIALGRQSLSACADDIVDARFVLGAVLAPLEHGCEFHSAIALAPAPTRLFDWLQQLSPTVKRVTVVYNHELNGWLMEHAATAAEQHGLELNALPAKDLREAAGLYNQVLGSGLGPGDALWLPQDNHTVDQRTILPLLLKASWDRNFILFSSNPAHVKRGVLFGLYPDNQAMGASLTELAMLAANGQSAEHAKLKPLMDVLIAVNVRTADHLGLHFSHKQKSAFNLTFPAPR